MIQVLPVGIPHAEATTSEYFDTSHHYLEECLAETLTLTNPRHFSNQDH